MATAWPPPRMSSCVRVALRCKHPQTSHNTWLLFIDKLVPLDVNRCILAWIYYKIEHQFFLKPPPTKIYSFDRRGTKYHPKKRYNNKNTLCCACWSTNPNVQEMLTMFTTVWISRLVTGVVKLLQVLITHMSIVHFWKWTRPSIMLFEDRMDPLDASTTTGSISFKLNHACQSQINFTIACQKLT